MMARAEYRMGISLVTLLHDFAADPVPAGIGIDGLAVDSRALRPGFLFLACRGSQYHGLAHVADARARGAVAIAYDPDGATQYLHDMKDIPVVPVANLGEKAGLIGARFYGDPTAVQHVVAVTGTNGKTSVSLITAQTLSDMGRSCGVLGTVGFGVYGRLETPTHTTPDAVNTQAWCARFRDQGVRHVSMEASSHALHQGRVNGVHVQVAVFTNLTRDHLDYHGDMHAYGEAKRRLFTLPSLKHAVLNLDDEFGATLAAGLPPGVKSIGYSLDGRQNSAGETLQATGLSLHAAGLSFDLESAAGRGHVDSRLLGRFNVQNLLAVGGTLLALGLEFKEMQHALSNAKTVPGRMECFGGGAELPLVVVDYAHTPDALEKALTAARSHCSGQLWCLFGCGGERDRGKRPQMGAIAERLADRVILTDDNPRGEDGDAIIAEILTGMNHRDRVQVQRARLRAVTEAVHAAPPGDVVLLAGKGHESTQVIGGRALPYSDRDTAARLIAEGSA